MTYKIVNKPIDRVKKCTKCGVDLTLGKNLYESALYTFKYRCIDCCKQAHRKKHPPVIRIKKEKPIKVRRTRPSPEEFRIRELKRAKKRILNLYNEKCCIICNEKNPIYLTFHHKKKGDREYNSIHDCPQHKLNEELDKCVCLCYNHHWAFHRIYSTHSYPDWDESVDEFKRLLEEYENSVDKVENGVI